MGAFNLYLDKVNEKLSCNGVEKKHAKLCYAEGYHPTRTANEIRELRRDAVAKNILRDDVINASSEMVLAFREWQRVSDTPTCERFMASLLKVEELLNLS